MYKDVYIGYGALSSYVSYTRNQDPDFSFPELKKYFDDFLTSQINLSESIYSILQQYPIAEMHVYNGRWADVRPMYDIAKAKGINIQVLEALNDGVRTYYKEIYYNVLPQNLKFRTDNINKVWSDSKYSDEEKQKLTNSFFIKRRNAEVTNDRNVYTTGQTTGLLPENWDETKKNVVIFNSSEDEFVALGKEYDSHSIFENQEEGIDFIVSNLKNHRNMHFYLRVHPNLTKVPYGYHKRLLKLGDKYPNLTVIPGDSKISTYTLIDKAEKIIVFSSTVGVEASYWGKPVILLAGAGYYYFYEAYIPEVKRAILNFIGLEKLQT